MTYNWRDTIELDIKDPIFRAELEKALDDIASTPDGSIFPEILAMRGKITLREQETHTRAGLFDFSTNVLGLSRYDIGLLYVKAADGTTQRMGLQTFLSHELTHINDPLYNVSCLVAVGNKIQEKVEKEFNTSLELSEEATKEAQERLQGVILSAFEEYGTEGEQQFNARYYPEEKSRPHYLAVGSYLESRIRMLPEPQQVNDAVSAMAAHLHTGPLHGGKSAIDEINQLRDRIDALPGCDPLPRNKNDSPSR